MTETRDQPSRAGLNGNQLPSAATQQGTSWTRGAGDAAADEISRQQTSDRPFLGFGLGTSGAANPVVSLPNNAAGGANIIVQSHADQEKDNLAKCGIVKLLLLGLGMNIDWDSGVVTNKAFAPWSKAFRIILSAPPSSRTARTRSLLQSFFDMEFKGSQRRDPMFSLLSMNVASTQFVNALLNGSLSTQDVASANQESATLNLMHFTRQNLRDKVAIVRTRVRKRALPRIRTTPSPFTATVRRPPLMSWDASALTMWMM